MIDWLIEKLGTLGATTVLVIVIFLFVNLIGGVF